jgi:hypothetical protein
LPDGNVLAIGLDERENGYVELFNAKNNTWESFIGNFESFGYTFSFLINPVLLMIVDQNLEEDDCTIHVNYLDLNTRKFIKIEENLSELLGGNYVLKFAFEI